MTGIPTDDGLYGDISDDLYHSDRGSLSSSGARKLLPPSCPALFRHAMDNPPESTSTFDIGKAAHSVILGKGQEIGVIDAPDWRSKKAKDQRDYAIAHGLIPLLEADYNAVRKMADKVAYHPLAQALLREGDAELSGYWHDAETGTRLRFRPDWLTQLASGRIACVDVKTSQSASPQDFSSSAARYGYAFQQEWYKAGLRALEIADDPIFLFLVVDKTPPHLVSVIALDDDAAAYGQRQMRRAIDIFARCTEADDWPGYPETVHTVGLPRWSYYQEGAE
jgi:PDDEXK-like domain of unknown function (DUF3799)